MCCNKSGKKEPKTSSPPTLHLETLCSEELDFGNILKQCPKNLKKSWHPSTLRNIERVWKAEQKHEAEQLKIEQLQRELAEERAREEIQTYAQDQGVLRKKDERLDWMYQGPAALVNREDYLLGRKVDKTFEILQQQEEGKEPVKEDDLQPGALFSESTINSTVDMANKIREDPLFSIMKREKEQRKNLLTNPVKMKQLQQMLKQSLSKDKRKKKKKKKEKKKKKRKRYQDSESSNGSSTDSEENNCKVKNEKREIFQDQVSKYKIDKLSFRDKAEIFERHEQKIYDKPRASRTPMHVADYHPGKKMKTFSEAYRNNSSSSKCSKHLESCEDYKTSLSSIKCKQREDDRLRVSNEYGAKQYKDHYRKEKQVSRRLTSEEKERLRQEMMDNAKWREMQRQKNVQRYNEEAKQEECMKGGDALEFIKPMLSKAANRGSLEDRIKQKIYTIQRNKADMDKNFARR